MKDKRGKNRQSKAPEDQPGHINEYRDIEDSKEEVGSLANTSGEDSTPIFLSGESTLQTPEEERHDKSVDPRKDDSIDVSNDDLHDIKLGRMTGREGTNERDR